MDEPTDLDKLNAFLRRDKTATVMFGVAVFLILSLMLAIGVFAIAGVALGLARNIRSARAAKNRMA